MTGERSSAHYFFSKERILKKDERVAYKNGDELIVFGDEEVLNKIIIINLC